jgi:glycosyltransferase involved in cell wall biosynthesis
MHSSTSRPVGERLRIALVVPPYFHVPSPGYGGVENAVADLADGLVDRGHTVHLIGAGKNGTKAKFTSVRNTIIPELVGKVWAEFAHAAQTRRAVLDIAKTAGLDLVHEHTQTGLINTSAYAAVGLPTLFTAHYEVVGELLKAYRALGSDVGMVAISRRQQELAPDLNWIGLAYNALKIETWEMQPQKEDYALFLGRHHPENAPHLALDAAHAAGVPLVLAGKCNEPLEKRYFDAEVRPRLGVNDTLHGVAGQTEKRKLLGGARCLVFPIQWEEPFGMVMIEAMASGTPVVALRKGAVPEVVDDGVTGIICDDVAELPEAIRRASDLDPAACRRRVEEMFTVDRLIDSYEAVYRKSLAKHRAGWVTSLINSGWPPVNSRRSARSTDDQVTAARPGTTFASNESR